MPPNPRSFLLLAAWLSATAAAAPEPPAYESFEQGLPEHWRPSRPGSVSVNGEHYKHGRHCLRWDWKRGDHIEVRHGLGDIRRQGGYGGTYSKSTFGVWLYVREPVDGALVFRFLDDDEEGGWFEFPLTFTGWRRAHLRYSWKPQFQGRVSPQSDRIVIRAPGSLDAGTVFIDLLVYNGIMDYRQQYVPPRVPWAPPPIDPVQFPVADAVPPALVAAADTVATRFESFLIGSQAVTGEMVDALAAEVAEWEIVRENGRVRGAPLVPHAGYYSEAGAEGVHSPAGITNLMKKVARTYRGATDSELRGRLARFYTDLSDHIHDQGMRPGNGFGWGWYSGRALGDATFIARDLLREAGKLDRDGAYLRANFGFHQVFDDSRMDVHMDHFHIDARYRLYGALLQADPGTRIRNLHAFSARLSKEILHQGPNGFKPDGSAFHHGFHYFAYADYSLNSLTWLVNSLRATPFAVTPAALGRLKKVLLAMRFYCNLKHLPLSLCGRHPFGQQLGDGKLLSLAECGSPDGSAPLDPELTAAYLRFHPEKQSEPRFASARITPEPHPRGNMTLPYAGLTAHRRDDWLATVKGYSTYVTHGETYQNNNRFGRYLSNGYLDILGGGVPVTRGGSGCAPDGWDFNRLDGTTVIVLPDAELEAPSRGTEMLRSDQTFVGGLSHRGWNGAFVMQIHGAERHDATFRARKTYFMLDDRVICLGSGIGNTDEDHPTQTTLFQKQLTPLDDPQGTAPELPPITVNGTEMRESPSRRVLPDDASNWLIDTQATGYYLPAGQRIHVGRQRQKHRDHADKEDLEGSFATAWIDHGQAPQDAGYEYVVLVRTTPDAMGGFAEAMSAAGRAPYRVHRKDARAHIVRDLTTRTWGCVFFEAFRAEADGRRTDELPIRATDGPCLVMLEQRGDRDWRLSLAQPDLNLKDHVSEPLTVRLSLTGAWRPHALPGNVSIVDSPDGSTVLQFVCRNGTSYDVALSPE